MCIAGLSGQSRGSPDQVMERDGEDGADHASDSHASEIQELREKLQMAQEEMELVRADLDKRLGQVQQAAADERADLTEQLRQAQLMAETAKEEGEEQRCKTQEAERQLDAQAKENEDLQRQLEETEQRAKTAIRLKIELEGLRQLEEVRRQFDRERDWYRREHDQDLVLHAELRAQLEDQERPTDDTTGEQRQEQALLSVV